MLICFLGDIHGNRDALEACLQHVHRLNPNRIYCLGDLVGWLPFGDRTLSRMQSLDIPTVAGNHDLLVAGIFTDHPNQLDRMQATAYTAGLLSTVPGAIEYLKNLPLFIEEMDFAVVHHSPFHLPEPGKPPTIGCFDYLDKAVLESCLKPWQTFPKRIIFSGHDHIPVVYELTGNKNPPTLRDVNSYHPEKNHKPLTIRLRSGCRYWIKAGSIGGPYRDGVAAANFAAYDTAAETITLYRLPYPKENLRRELASHRFARNLPTLKQFIKLLES